MDSKALFLQSQTSPDSLAAAWATLEPVELRRLRVLLDCADTCTAQGSLVDTGLEALD